jgi:pteridine reductase
MRISLKGQAALITGASRRVGRAIAQRLASEGVHLILHYRNSRSDAEALAADLQNMGVNAWTLQTDLSRPEEAGRLVDRAWELSGGFSILINNASLFEKGDLEEFSREDFIKHFDGNTWAPFILARSFVRKGGEGQVVNLLDARVHGYNFTHVAYHLNKQLLEYLTRHMALEFAPMFRVNAVAPGLILPPPGQDMAYLDRLKDTVPLKRHGHSEDIAEAVAFLLSNTFITGQTLYVDGGRHLRD